MGLVTWNITVGEKISVSRGEKCARARGKSTRKKGWGPLFGVPLFRGVHRLGKPQTRPGPARFGPHLKIKIGPLN